jgi:hypothetical protein
MPTDHGSIDVQLRGELGAVARSEPGNATEHRVGGLVGAWVESRVSSPVDAGPSAAFQEEPKDLRDVGPGRFVTAGLLACIMHAVGAVNVRA